MPEPRSTSAASWCETPGARIDRYELLQKIGEGGFGIVWMAEQKEPIRRNVALKILKSGVGTREVVTRFEAERQALALMDHPNIARVFDAGATANGLPYFVMELVRGIPITRYCDENRLSPAARLRLFIAVCHGVRHAHQKGIIHRDLKPSNIIVTLQDREPVPKIIDFGIAKAISGARLTEKTLFTQFHALIGTPAYMSPEQIEMSGIEVDTRSDIYSLGIVLYELLAGRPPFDADALAKSGLEAMRRTIRETDPPRPSQRLDTFSNAERMSVARERATDPVQLHRLLSGDLDAIAMHCLEKDRALRYETVNALALDIEHHLRNQPIAARPPRRLYRAQKFIRRHKIAVAATAAVTLSLCAGTIVSSILLVRERASHREAEAARDAETIHASRTSRNLAEQLLADDRTPDGLAWLVHAARKNPRDPTIGPRLASALTSRGFLIPTAPAVRFPSAVLNVNYAAGGRKVAAYYDDGTVGIIDTTTGAHVRTKLPAGLAAPAVVISGRFAVVRCKDEVVRILDPANGHIEREFYFRQKIARISGARPDAPILVIVLADDSVVVAEALTGLIRVMPFRFPPQTTARLSPDGHWLAVFNSPDGISRLWNLASGEGRPLAEAGGAIIDAAFSPDGTRLLIARRPRPAEANRMYFRLLTLPELKVLAEPESGPAGPRLTFSPDSCVFSIASQFGQQLYSARTGERIGPLLSTGLLSFGPMAAVSRWRESLTYPRPMSVGALFFGSPKQPRFVTLSGPETRHELTVRDALTSQPVLRPIVHGGGLHTVRAIDEGNTLFSRRYDGAMLVWDLHRGELRAEGGVRDQDVFDVALAPDQNEFVMGSPDGTVQRLRISRGPAQPLVLPHPAPDMPAPFLPGRPARLLWLTTTRASVINVTTGQPTNDGFVFPKPIVGITSYMRGISVRPDLRFLVVEPVTGGWQSWELAEGRLVRAVALEDTPAGSGMACFSRSGDLVAIALDAIPQRARVWHLDTGRAASAWLPSDVQSIGYRQSASLAPDGGFMAVGDERGGVTIWNVASSQRVRRLQQVEADFAYEIPVYDVRFSPDGARIATKNAGGEVLLWDSASGRLVGKPVVHGPSWPGLEFSPSGDALLTWGLDGIARVWDAQNGAPLGQPMAHRGVQISAAAFSPDGRRVVTTALDNTARIWDTRTAQPITGPLRHRSLISSCEFSPDGRFVCVRERSARDHAGAFNVWSVPPDGNGAPAPEWLLQLATICAQKTINDAGVCVDAPQATNEIDDVRHILAALPDDAPFVEWGRWILDDRPDRPIAPGFTITPAEAERIATQPDPAACAYGPGSSQQFATVGSG